MQQWIPKGHTLEPKIWGEVGLRQALYIGLGILSGVLLFFALSRFGLVARIGALVLPICLGAVIGFLTVKGMMPERSLLHRLRFRLRRAGTLGVWDTGVAISSPGDLWLGDIPVGEAPVAEGPSPVPTPSFPKGPAPASPKLNVSRPVAYLMEAGAFGLAFTAAAWAVASGMLSYAAKGVLP